MSDEDVGIGTRWQTEIAKHLSSVYVGVFVITPENQHKPWINFEAGAVSREVENGRVMTIVVGMDRSELNGPLQQFQNVVFEKSDMKKLVQDINRALGEPSREAAVARVFELAWPEFERDVQSVPIPASSVPMVTRSDEDLLREVVDTVRDLARDVRKQDSEYETLAGIVIGLLREYHKARNGSSDDVSLRFRTPNKTVSLGLIRQMMSSSTSIVDLAKRLGVDEEELKAHLNWHHPRWQDDIVPF
jgi:hypothetical protein